MAVRIRLQRFGKKGAPFYHVVAADSRSPRDGKFIERLGSYNPMTNPATIDLDVDKAVKWLRNGAQPSDTARSVLSVKGAMLKHHLLRGVDKGALTVEQAEAKFKAWVSDKESKLQKIVSDKEDKNREDKKKRFAAEVKIKEEIAAKVAKKKTAELTGATEATEATEATSEAAPEAEVAEEVVVETPAEEAPAEVEAPVEVEAPAAEESAAAETPAEAAETKEA